MNQGEIIKFKGEELTRLDLRDERDSDSQVSGSGDCGGGDAVRKSRGGMDKGEDGALSVRPVEIGNRDV